MELSDAIRGRRMVRTFDPRRPVPEHILERSLDAATRAPSAGFSQGWDFVVLTGADDRARFWAAASSSAASETPDRWLRGVSAAPCLVVCCSDPQRYRHRYAEPDKAHQATSATGANDEDNVDGEDGVWPIPYWDVDTGMAALLMLLTGVDEGVGGLFFGVPGPAMDQVRSTLDIPTDRRLVGVVALGYPLPDVRSPSLRRGRRPVSEVAHAGRFGVPFRAPMVIGTRPKATQANKHGGRHT